MGDKLKIIWLMDYFNVIITPVLKMVSWQLCAVLKDLKEKCRKSIKIQATEVLSSHGLSCIEAHMFTHCTLKYPFLVACCSSPTVFSNVTNCTTRLKIYDLSKNLWSKFKPFNFILFFCLVYKVILYCEKDGTMGVQ